MAFLSRLPGSVLVLLSRVTNNLQVEHQLSSILKFDYNLCTLI